MKTRRRKRGGSAIGHGGFGCVFHPNIECRLSNGRILKPSMRKVTKLIRYKRYFDEEARDVKMIQALLPKIKNYKRYFIYETVSCKPVRISNNDLINFNKECKKKFSTLNTRQLLTLNALVYPFGGENLSDYTKRIRHEPHKMTNLHFLLLDLLENAIVPMNRLGIYHCDVKLDNLLIYYDEIKIIDWGFVSLYYPGSNIIPEKFYTFSMHYNMPITILLLQPELQRMIDLKNAIELTASCKKYIMISTTQSGHFRDLEKIYTRTKPDYLELQFTDFVIKKLRDVIINYLTPTHRFDVFEFFSTVYIHNTDIHAFVIAYYYFCEPILPKEHLSRLYLFVFDVVFNSFNKRLDPSEIMHQIINLKYFNEG